MGAITERLKKGGGKAHFAQVKIVRDGKIVHRENRAFERWQAAAAWLEKRETELRASGRIERAKAEDPSLAMVIDQCIADLRRGRRAHQVPGVLVQRGACGRIEARPVLRSDAAEGVRACLIAHPIEDGDTDGGFGLLAGERAGMDLAAEDALLARHRGFRLAPLLILGLLLLPQATALGDGLDVAVPLGGSRLGGITDRPASCAEPPARR